jgi:hypothetical protein
MTGEATDRPRLRLSAPVRRAILTLHIVVAVGRLGDSAGFLAVAIRGASADAAAWDVFALTTAATLAVYKPGRRRSPRRTPDHLRPG